MPHPRKKTCSQCREGKTRCNLETPKCKRCVSRGLRCDYTEARPRGVDRTPWSRAAELPTFLTKSNSELGESVNAVEVVQAGYGQIQNDNRDSRWFMPETDWNNTTLTSEDTRAMLQSNTGPPTDLAFQNNDTEHNAWTNDCCTQLSTDHGLNLQELQTHQSPNNTGTCEEFFQMGGWLSPRHLSPSASAWAVFNVPKSRPLLLTQKRPATFGQSLSSNHLFRSIISYPTEFLSRTSLPPFIHTHTYCCFGQLKCVCDSASTHGSFPTPLANCISIMHMWKTRTPESNALVWRTITSEQQRLHSEYREYDNLNLLAALQAITLYLLLLASEKDHNEHQCVALILTMGEISVKVFNIGYSSRSEFTSTSTSWEEWSFQESLRRTIMVLFLINELIDIRIDYWAGEEDCDGLMQAFLPCSKDLWESSTRENWESLYKRYSEKRSSTEMLRFGMLKTSQLVESDNVGATYLKDLSHWSSRLDALGRTVMMTAFTLFN